MIRVMLGFAIENILFTFSLVRVEGVVLGLVLQVIIT